MKPRENILLHTAWISVVGNALLSAVKIVAGLLSGSMAVLSDGLDSASDVVTSGVLLVATSVISRPPDSRFVFGQEKAEHVASTVLSFVIFFVGAQLLVTSVGKLFRPEVEALPSLLAVWVTGISIVGKLLLAWYQFRQGKKINSSMLKANAVNMRGDVIISVGVLVGLGFTYILDLPVVDTIVALMISLYIIWSAIEIFKEANLVLMGGLADTSVYQTIIEAVEAVPGASNPHRIRAEHVGNQYNIMLDIEVDGSATLTEAHRIAQEVEDSITRAVGQVYDIVVHVEPSGVVHSGEKFGVNKDNLGSNCRTAT